MVLIRAKVVLSVLVVISTFVAPLADAKQMKKVKNIPIKTNVNIPLDANARLMQQGMWKDSHTGLIWMRCSIGQTWDGTTCLNNARRTTWYYTQPLMNSFNNTGGFAGFTDWRLPTESELASIRKCSTGFSHNIDIVPNDTAIDEVMNKRDDSTTIASSFVPNVSTANQSVSSQLPSNTAVQSDAIQSVPVSSRFKLIHLSEPKVVVQHTNNQAKEPEEKEVDEGILMNDVPTATGTVTVPAMCQKASISPTIDSLIFPNTPADYFWSSSVSEGYSDGAWAVYFGYGYTSNGFKGDSNFLRAVRTDIIAVPEPQNIMKETKRLTKTQLHDQNK